MVIKVWPAEIEDHLNNMNLFGEELDFSLKDFCSLNCNILDIPVHNTNNKKNIIESLHVMFTLFSEFKMNQHFQQKNDNYGQNQNFTIDN